MTSTLAQSGPPEPIKSTATAAPAQPVATSAPAASGSLPRRPKLTESDRAKLKAYLDRYRAQLPKKPRVTVRTPASIELGKAAARATIATMAAKQTVYTSSAIPGVPTRIFVLRPTLANQNVPGIIAVLNGAPQISQIQIDNGTPTAAGAGSSLYVQGVNLGSPTALPRVTLDLGNCGKVDLPVLAVTASGDQLVIHPVPDLDVDLPAKQGTLSVTTDKGTTSRPLTYAATLNDVVADLDVIEYSDYGLNGSSFMDNDPGIGLREAQNSFTLTAGGTNQGGPHRLQRLSDPPGNGTDEFGRGVNVLHGYTAQAVITAAESEPEYRANGQFAQVAALVPIRGTPSNRDRGASIRQAPSATSLQTLVDWFYSAGGQSINYHIQWKFTGPRNMRPLDSMPQTGKCGD